MQKNLADKIRVVLKIGASSSFGISKFLIVVLASLFVDNEGISNYLSDGFVVQLLANFTAIGFCGLLLTRMPKLSLADCARLYSELILFTIVFCAFSTPVLFFIEYLGFLVRFSDSLINLFCLSLYLLVRHFFQAKLFYWRILALDFLSFALTICAAFVFKYNLLISSSLGMFISFLLFSVKFFVRFNFSVKRSGLAIAFHNGASTSMTSWPFMLIPAVLLKYSGVDLAAYVGVMITYLNVAQMLIRSLMFDAIVNFAKAVDSTELNAIYKKLRVSVITSTLVLTSVSYILANIMKKPQSVHYLAYSILVLFSIVISQYSAISSSLIISLEKTGRVFKVNSLFSIFCLGALIVSNFLNNSILFVVILVLASFIRAKQTDSVAKDVMRECEFAGNIHGKNRAWF